MHNLLPSGVSFAGGPGFEYQLPMVEAAVEAIIRGDKEVLIAACPSAGKTNIAFEVVRRLVATGHVNRALVLAWARVAIKDQWLRRVREQAPGLESHLWVDIPQRRHRIDGQFDLLCVDEGHQNYEVEGGMVSQVRSRVKARTTLILTGSPSVFIRRKLKPAAVFSLEELHAAGKASNLTIEVGTSAYNLLDKHYNAKGEVTQVGQRLQTQARTNETLEKLLDGLHARLKLAHRDMDSAWNRVQLRGAKRKKWWGRILTGLKKTIVACNDIAQAEQTARYFRAQGVEVLVSHGGNDRVKAPDVDSENIEVFKKSAAPLLVVVDRAQLGYDNPELANFIDMTGSRNPDRIFQMLCRVVRVDPASPALKKLFVKVMPAAFSDQNLLFFMEGVLNLARRDVFETYDGTGFYRGPVPARQREPRGPRTGKKGHKRDDEIAWSPVLEAGMSLYGPSGYFTAIKHTNADGYEPVGQVRLGSLLGLKVDAPEDNKRLILEFFEKNGRWPNSSAHPPTNVSREERRLGCLVVGYTGPSHTSFDPGFRSLLESKGWRSRDARVQSKQDEIVAFFEKNGRWPNKHSDNRKEVLLGIRLGTYTRKASRCFDPEFLSHVSSLGWVNKKGAVLRKQDEIVAFFEKNGRWPRQHGGTPEESKLGEALSRYSREKCYDPAYVSKISAMGWKSQKDAVVSKKADIIAFFEEKGRWPSQHAPQDAEERTLGISLSHYLRRGANYDPAFKAQLVGLGYKGQKDRVKVKEDEIVAFFEKNGRWPNGRGGDRAELLLGRLLGYYVKVNPTFLVRVRSLGWMTQKERTAARCQEALDFRVKTGRWPNAYSDDEKEKRLGQFLYKATQDSQSPVPGFRARCAELDPERFGKKG